MTEGVRVGVVGHVEWACFARVERMPRTGEIVHVRDAWEVPAGGGAVVAVQLARLAGEATLFTALGDDELGRRAEDGLRALGVRVEAARRRGQAQRRVFVHVDDAGERTITVIGDRLGPRRRDRLPWAELAEFDAVFFTAGDVGALRAARAAGVLTATPRALATLAGAGVRIDALIGSARDAGERYRPGDLDPPPGVVIRTEGPRGGSWRSSSGVGRYAAATPPGPPVDAYGCGDSFAAGVTFGLGRGDSLSEALALGARCGAVCLTGRGPYEARLRAAGR